jgi:hypothetical protein
MFVVFAFNDGVFVGPWPPLSKTNNKPAPRLIHNRPGPVRCENAWYRSVTSQQRAGPEKGDRG